MADRTETYCRICTSACGMIAEVEDGELVSFKADRDHPLSGCNSCSKGRGLPAFRRGENGLLAPQVRRGDELVKTGSDEALDDLTDRLKTIIAESRPQAIGFFMGAGAFFDSLLYLTARGAAAAIGSPQVYSDQTIDLERHCQDAERLAAAVEPFDLDRAATLTRLPREE